ncbi:MAG: transketolase C-terminal domain-containing protein [Armatimonadota bacterium]
METALKQKMKVMEGSIAIAETVTQLRPHVISAYPITPQTHIVEALSRIVADGRLHADFIKVDSEQSAASACVGASAAGARAYTATTSQGLLLMAEVLFSMAGMRLPVLLTCVNRSVSSPLSIWNDHQDSMTVRDSGWIQLYAEDNQEAIDMHVQGYKIAEKVKLPLMICIDGFLLTHTYEPLRLYDQDEIDKFVPPYKPKYHLTPKDPHTFGCFAEPDKYTEFRYMTAHANLDSKSEIVAVAKEFKEVFGRFTGDLLENYKCDDADTVLVGMGTIVSILKAVADQMREEGKKVGVCKIRTFRPFPKEEIRNSLKDKKNIVIFDKSLSMGLGSIVGTDVKDALYGLSSAKISTIIAGLAGRDIPVSSVKKMVEKAEKQVLDNEFMDLKTELLGGEI